MMWRRHGNVGLSNECAHQLRLQSGLIISCKTIHNYRYLNSNYNVQLMSIEWASVCTVYHKLHNETNATAVTRSICGGQLMALTRRIPAYWSTSAGMWTTRQGWSRRSTPSTCVLVEQWSWSSSWQVPEPWSPSASGRQCPGTWWCRRTGPCWRTGPCGCRRRTSWWSCRSSRGCRMTPCRGTTAGTSPPGSGSARCRWWWPMRTTTVRRNVKHRIFDCTRYSIDNLYSSIVDSR